MEPVEGTGRRWHINVLFAHVLADNHPKVMSGEKKAGAFVAPWGYNAMVSYLLEPKKDKYVDPEPRFINCNRENVYLDDDEVGEMMTFHDRVVRVRELARQGFDTAEVIEQVSDTFPSDDHWQLQHLWRASAGTEPDARVAFVPEGLKGGILDGATSAQRYCCHWIESTPVSEASGLWLKGPKGMGKTALLKILMLRYDEQVFVLKKRAARGWFDDTSLIGLKPHHSLFLVNDLKGHESSRYYTRSWPMETLEFLLMLTDGFPKNFSWAGREYCQTPVGKAVITSTWAPPDNEEFKRRYDVVEIQEDGSLKLLNARVPGTVEEDLWIIPREGLASAPSYFPETDADESEKVPVEHQHSSCSMDNCSMDHFSSDAETEVPMIPVESAYSELYSHWLYELGPGVNDFVEQWILDRLPNMGDVNTEDISAWDEEVGNFFDRLEEWGQSRPEIHAEGIHLEDCDHFQSLMLQTLQRMCGEMMMKHNVQPCKKRRYGRMARTVIVDEFEDGIIDEFED